MKADVQLLITADGSHTAVNQVLNKTYHSIHGAYQESQRVYIELGLFSAFDAFPDGPIHVFEMGFGTGLNALLTAREAERQQRQIFYTTIDAYPMPPEATSQLNYDQFFGTSYLTALHESRWNEPVEVNPYFRLTKIESELQALQIDERFQLIYYDAFAPTAQPELWETEIFQQLADLLLPGGLLTTYCSRSYVQRNMRAAGFTVTKHSGPLHKRDILKAEKVR
ncbi:tRNA (5-methylaminomethyl-2-thiouridine)(34)-methyltransferase MnmC2 [Spirosoma agri]|uniref:tRNA (5-methylaminomethyl-2-thiouridine)(34)-methyltransferase MnmD n=1 Tax=Spirosoma agri TaxID=1987381 RepID=A0A6M0IDJ6_9BACT|nr:tRNA (5-methylaminomethyl-2-thiouridine)(34)-methyltransferase MnmD [Spirosoma agri]NEU65411.1 tRNA (5-methylaminomethyl-2-thiouridine)(34)-methyltransferase MnmD [Spirosoma agri]